MVSQMEAWTQLLVGTRVLAEVTSPVPSKLFCFCRVLSAVAPSFLPPSFPPASLSQVPQDPSQPASLEAQASLTAHSAR